MFLFFFFFSVHLTINALFFNDDTMHKIYMDEGNYNFIYQIPQIIYSSLISGIINAIIKYLSLSQDNIVKLKQSKKKKNLEERHRELLTNLKIKFIIFFIISFILLLMCWYYITCFCGVFINTQIHLIKDSIVSFAMGLLYPFGIYLIPGIFRIPALSDTKKNKKYLYQFSSILQMI